MLESFEASSRKGISRTWASLALVLLGVISKLGSCTCERRVVVGLSGSYCVGIASDHSTLVINTSRIKSRNHGDLRIFGWNTRSRGRWCKLLGQKPRRGTHSHNCVLGCTELRMRYENGIVTA